MYASPGLLALAESSPAVAEFLAGVEVVGRIDAAGLRSPGELRVIQGSEPSERLVAIRGWGGKADPLVDLGGPLVFFVPVVVVVAIVPTLLGLWLLVRLTASEQSRRVAVLHALGVSRGAAKVLVIIDVIIAVVAGVLAAAAVVAWIGADATGVPGTGFSFFAQDFQVSPLALGTVALATVGTAVLMANIASGGGAEVSVRPRAHRRAPAWWWVAPSVVGGSGLLAAAQVDVRDRPEATSWMLAAAGLVLLGIPALVSVVFHVVERLVVARSQGAVGLVVGRWMTTTSTASARCATALAAGGFAVSAALPFVGLLTTPVDDAEVGLDAARGYNLTVAADGPEVQRVAAVQGVRTALPLTAMEGDGAAQALWGTCADLMALVATPDAECEAPAWINTYGGEMEGYLPDLDYPLDVAPGVLTLDGPPERSVVVGLNPELHAALLTGERLPTPTSEVIGVVVNLADGARAKELFDARVAASAPNLTHQNAFTDQVEASRALAAYVSYLVLCGVAGVLGVVLCLVAALVKDADQRRAGLALLRRIGIKAGTSRSIHLTSQFLAVAVPLLVASSSSALVWWCAGHLYWRAGQGAASFVVLFTAPLAVAMTLALITLPSALGVARGAREAAALRQR